jgi:hypothetical protein
MPIIMVAAEEKEICEFLQDIFDYESAKLRSQNVPSKYFVRNIFSE